MYTLGIETSCDETAASVVEDAHKILSNVIASSLSEHAKFGGVVPEIACRLHVEWIHRVIDQALQQANIPLNEIDGIAVTEGPGLVGALLVGISMAKAISFALGKPLLGVHHLQAHLYANFLGDTAPQYPYLGLIVSGGHTILVLVSSLDSYQVLGQTMDDAAGEAFDKVAKLLGLGYPGGPVIDKRAKEGDPTAIRFPRAMAGEKNYNFSFSGLKTAVMYYVKENFVAPSFINDLCASFQEAVVDVLVQKSLMVCRELKCTTLVAGGGVSANSRLREALLEQGTKQGIRVLFPPKGLSIDNAAMIAGLGGALIQKGYCSDFSLTAQANWPINNSGRLS